MVSKNPKSKERENKRQTEIEEITKLDDSIKELTDTTNLKYFTDLPLSQKTIQGLKKQKYIEMTDIQKMSIHLGLQEKDILGAAKTGSGKTLAFLVPVLECLYRRQWTAFDGLGALIICPTRELAIQIFDVLKLLGQFHSFSAGLVIGGHNLKEEKGSINRMNILICTPGRLLQHMDQTAGFDTSNLQLLVLDEADRILDMGFEKTINAIIEHIPRQRITFLFSATQTKSVKDLARLSLKNPEYVSVHEQPAHSTPADLKQHYLVVNLEEKLDILYSFIKSHLQSKVLVFVSSCKQVRYINEVFCKMQPGIPLLCLHGRQKQARRMGVFYEFCNKKHAVLFCTDIAARGLDFPTIDWVIQLDCPEDGDTYIHRVGRTARYHSSGQSLMFILPSEEEGMKELFEKKKIPIDKLLVNPAKKVSVMKQAQAFCSQDPELKYLAKKKVFNVNELPLENYALSLGLASSPALKFFKKSTSKNESRDEKKFREETTRVDRMMKKQNVDVLSEHYKKVRDVYSDSDDETDQDLFELVKKDHDISEVAIEKNDLVESRRDRLKTRQKYKLKEKDISASHLRFDDEGEGHLSYQLEDEETFAKKGDLKERKQQFLAETAKEMKEADKEDKILAAQKKRDKKLKMKRKERQEDVEELPLLKQHKESEDSDEDTQASEIEDDSNLEELALSLLK